MLGIKPIKIFPILEDNQWNVYYTTKIFFYIKQNDFQHSYSKKMELDFFVTFDSFSSNLITSINSIYFLYSIIRFSF